MGVDLGRRAVARSSLAAFEVRISRLLDQVERRVDHSRVEQVAVQ